MKKPSPLYLEESIMFDHDILFGIEENGTKTKLASSLLIMTKVGGRRLVR